MLQPEVVRLCSRVVRDLTNVDVHKNNSLSGVEMNNVVNVKRADQ